MLKIINMKLHFLIGTLSFKKYLNLEIGTPHPGYLCEARAIPKSIYTYLQPNKNLLSILI